MITRKEKLDNFKLLYFILSAKCNEKTKVRTNLKCSALFHILFNYSNKCAKIHALE